MNLHRITALAAATSFAAAPALAKDDAGRVVKRGSCSDGSTWKLKVQPDDARLEVEFEVDQNRNGVPWKVALRRDGALVASGTWTTRAPSGSFSFEKSAISCSTPFSSTLKLPLLRPPINRPLRSITRTGIETSWVLTLMTSSSALT